MEKKYINGVKVKEIEGKYWSFFSVSVNIETLQQYANEKGYVNMNFSKRKEPWKFGETHSVTLNEFKPKAKENTMAAHVSIEDLPF